MLIRCPILLATAATQDDKAKFMTGLPRLRPFSMIIRLLKIAVSASVLITSSCATGEEIIWENSPAGKCYESLPSFMTVNFGQKYNEDENIHLEKELHDSINDTDYIWAYDATPEINITKLLFKVDSNGKSCVILYAPNSSTISEFNFQSGNPPALMTSSDTPPPGFAQTEIVYLFDKSNGFYRPKECNLISGNSGIRKSTPCNRIYEGGRQQ